MHKIKQKRDRVSTEAERFHLSQIILKYKDVVENPNSDFASIKTKAQTWQQIAAEFNANRHNYPRNAVKLKKMWSNMKTKCRKLGDGYQPKIEESPVSNDITVETDFNGVQSDNDTSHDCRFVDKILGSEEMYRRERVSTEEERFRLSQIVLKYKDVVENPNSDFASIKTKAQTWQQIAAEFNANRHNYPRNAVKLKKMWSNMKTKCRKLGDGYQPKIEESPVSNYITVETDFNTVQSDNDTSHDCRFVDKILGSEEVYKRERVSTEEERFRLSHIVLKYKDVVENPNSDFASIKTKAQTWQQIAAEFNANRHNYPRNAVKLKKMWSNMKTKCRKLGDGYQPKIEKSPVSNYITVETDFNTVQSDNDISHDCKFVDNILGSEEIMYKRERVTTKEERFRLSQIVSKYKDVVENPKVDFVSIKTKSKAWQQIAAEFNANSHNYPRNAVKLKKIWISMKRRNSLKIKENAVSSDITVETDFNTMQLDDTFQNCRFINSVLGSEEIEDSTMLQSQRSPHKRVEELPDTGVEGNKNNTRSNYYLTKEAELRFKKSEYLFDLEKQIGEMIKQEQQLKLELVKQQLETAKNEEKFLVKKRDMELILLKNKVIDLCESVKSTINKL